MSILADENIDYPIIAALREAGFKVFSIFEESRGIMDASVLSRSANADTILLTGDKDFGEHVFRMKSAHRGVVLIRFFNLSMEVKIRLVLEVFQKHSDKLEDSFTVVEPGKLRIRK